MALLKTIKAATLMETLVATALIIVAFMISSMVLNNLFSSTVKSNTRAIEARLNQLQYLELNDQLQLPYNEDFADWEIAVDRFIDKGKSKIEFEAIHRDTKKELSIISLDD